MSYQLTQLAIDIVGLSPPSKACLIVLCRYADDDGGSCFPSQQALADKTGYTDRTVRNALDDLETRQVIHRQGRGRGSCYALSPSEMTKLLPEAGSGKPERGSGFERISGKPERGSGKPERGSGKPERGSGLDSRQNAVTDGKPERDSAYKIIIGNLEESEICTSNSAPPPLTDSAPEPFESDFAEWWTIYPRKVQRRAAFKMYQARRRAKDGKAEMLQAVTNYAAHVRGREPEYILHARTFLNNDRWQDYLDGGPALTEAPATIQDQMAVAMARRYGET